MRRAQPLHVRNHQQILQAAAGLLRIWRWLTCNTQRQALPVFCHQTFFLPSALAESRFPEDKSPSSHGYDGMSSSSSSSAPGTTAAVTAVAAAGPSASTATPGAGGGADSGSTLDPAIVEVLRTAIQQEVRAALPHVFPSGSGTAAAATATIYDYGNLPSYRSSASNCQATWRRRSSPIVSPASNRSQASTKD